MADMKRYEKRVNPINGDVYMACVSDGAYVLYDDHVAALAQQAGAVESEDWPFIEEVGTNGKPTGYWIRKGSKAADRYMANKADEVSDEMIDVALASAWGHKMRGDDAQRSIIRGMLQAVRREYPGFIASSAPGGGGEVQPIPCSCGHGFVECFGSGREWYVGCKPCSKRDGGREHAKGRTRDEAVRKWNESLSPKEQV